MGWQILDHLRKYQRAKGNLFNRDNHLPFVFYISYHLQYMELLKRKSIKVYNVMRQDYNPNWNAKKSFVRSSSMISINICASVSD